MLELLTSVVGVVLAIIVAKNFINVVEKEIAAHDAANIKGDDTDDR